MVSKTPNESIAIIWSEDRPVAVIESEESEGRMTDSHRRYVIGLIICSVGDEKNKKKIDRIKACNNINTP